MRHRVTRSIAIAGVLALLAAAPVSASATSVTIDIHINFTTGETFTADGICPSGEAFSYGHHVVGNGRATVFHLFKDLVCDDGSGTITIRIDASAVFGMPGTIGGWNVVSGTGDYAGIGGGGHIVGIAFPGGIDDHYTGMLTN
jgi:hypothetical protein